MRTRMWAAIAASWLLVAPVGCGENDGASNVVPDAETLATALLAPSDLEGRWEVNPGPDDSPIPASGVIPEDARSLLPSIELCPAATAESRAAADGLRWMVFRQLDMTPDDPLTPPSDRTGHMVFVQQFLLAGQPADVEATFELLRAGMEACLGEVDTGEEGPGFATEMTTPDVGDERYGVLVTVEEAGGRGEWLLHNTLVREGGVLMLVDVVDIHVGVEPLFTTEDVGAIVTTAADNLSDATAG